MAEAKPKLTFCDGDSLFTINGGDCNAGINFGTRKPDCVCVTGVYRSWTEDCELYDGFIQEFCTTLVDENIATVGVKLLDSISDTYSDTAAVFGYEVSDYHNWTAYLIGSEGKTKSDTFYSLNGFPVMLSKDKEKFICIEPKPRVRQHVCRFYSSENKGVWTSEKETTIKVMSSCDPEIADELREYSVAPLKEHRCYDIVGNNMSECQLSCEGGPEVGVPPFREKRTDGGTNRTELRTSIGTTEGEGSMIDDDESEEKEEVVAPGISNSNFFIHRRLNKYIRMRQVGLLPRPDFSMIAPNRTFSLLDIAKRVVRGACPSTFVSDIFLEQALELFVILHKGQDFRFIEDIENRDFKWIQEILLTCRVGAIENPLNVVGDKSLAGCQNDGLIQRVCHTVDTDTQTCQDVTGGSFHQYGKYHYIMDVVWNIIDMTHVVCHPHFKKSYRMFHVWEQASEKLFTRDLRGLWHKPDVDLRVYDALLSPKAMVDMINLERCTEAAYKRSALPRLARPPKPKSHFRRKRAIVNKRFSVAETVDVYCARKPADVAYDC
ncbi:hypothetical protein Ocin01_03886 [Orchesella cincta]|uniref:Uncharacterized protein n=1 Tax=Orchesella cincta TaxID=48709 RepID=A0A1D2NC06_ORCCI|nr:hypothetical protein Ocin01_03886 [Orchesella cincta]